MAPVFTAATVKSNLALLYANQYAQTQVVALDPATGTARWRGMAKDGTPTDCGPLSRCFIQQAFVSDAIMVVNVQNIAYRGGSKLPSGAVQAFDTHNGAMRWQMVNAHAISMNADITVLSTAHGMAGIADILGVQTATGKMVWHTSLPADYSVLTNPSGASTDLLYASNAQDASTGAPPHTLVALRTTDGSIAWRIQTPTMLVDTFINDAIYVTDTHYLTAYDAQTGKQRWRKLPPTGSFAMNIVAASNGTLFALAIFEHSATIQLLAINAADGSTRWTAAMSCAYVFDLALAASDVATACTNAQAKSTLTVFAAATGQEQWQVASPVTLTSPSDQLQLKSDGGVLFIADDTSMAVFVANNGERLWSYAAPTGQFLQLSDVGNGAVYGMLLPLPPSQEELGASQVGTMTLIDFNGRTGQQAWHYPVTAFVADVVLT